MERLRKHDKENPQHSQKDVYKLMRDYFHNDAVFVGAGVDLTATGLAAVTISAAHNIAGLPITNYDEVITLMSAAPWVCLGLVGNAFRLAKKTESYKPVIDTAYNLGAVDKDELRLPPISRVVCSVFRSKNISS